MEKPNKTPLHELMKSHTPSAIRQRIDEAGSQHSYLRDFIYGSIDGAVTTFAVVSGVAGANLSTKVVIILGAANLFGDGFSMAVSNYLGTRAEEDLRKKARKTEEDHIAIIPDGEREEIRQIFAAKGFSGEELEKIVKVITSDDNQWINTMLKEELGMTLQGPSCIRAALTTFVAFAFVGFIPLIAFIAHWIFPQLQYNPFLISTILTGLAFFGIGAMKAQFVGHKWYWSGIETFVVGSIAAFLAYLVGILLRNIA